MVPPIRLELITLKLKASCSSIELQGRINKVATPVGLEPTTYSLEGSMVGTIGLEPMTCRLEGDCCYPSELRPLEFI